MKIVAKSNFDDETFCEYIIAENVSVFYGELIERLLINDMRENDNSIATLVEDDYVPFVWEP